MTGVAARIDASFGTNDGDANSATTASNESGAPPPGEEEEGENNLDNDDMMMDDDMDMDMGDGWGDDDDFGDEDLDLDFGDDDQPLVEEPLDEEPPANNDAPLENGGLNGGMNGERNGAPTTSIEDKGSSADDDDAAGGPAAEAALEEAEDIIRKIDATNAAPDGNSAGEADAETAAEEDEEAQQQPQQQGAQQTTMPQSQPQSPPPTYDAPSQITVSAPGKALVAGGYLVLESPNPGVVLAADGCRFHSTVTFRPPHVADGGGVVGNSVDASWESIPLDVYSPQFDKVFSYYLSYSLTESNYNNEEDEDEEDACLRLQPRTARHEPNRFVEKTLLLAMGYLRQSLGARLFRERLNRQQPQRNGDRVALAVKLRADNDFYSQIDNLRERGLDLTPDSLEKLEPFLPCPKDEAGEMKVHKTGMGSSAALVTSLVGALLRFFGVVALPTKDAETGEGREEAEAKHTNGGHGAEKEGLRIAHNLSQICHCHAQGKVGSGFDVSSAVYGSHVYKRFSKGVVNDVLEGLASCATKGEAEGLQLSQTTLEQLAVLVNNIEWDCKVDPVNLPPGLELLMADVHGGSESPSMAKKVLEWKRNKRTGFMDDYYWKDLKRCNNKIVSLLSENLAATTFLDGLRRDGEMIVSTRTAEQWKKPMPSSWYKFEGSSWDVALTLLDLRMTFLECRQNLKGMGKSAGVPIEPEEQSKLADATMKLPGVVAAGVPGAGGYDALFVIYVKGPATEEGRSDHVRDEIGKLWRDMNEENEGTTVCPLSVRAAGSGDGLIMSDLEW